MKPANSILSSYGTTVFEVMSRLAIEHEAVNLGQGFPDGNGPDDVRAAAHEAPPFFVAHRHLDPSSHPGVPR